MLKKDPDYRGACLDYLTYAGDMSTPAPVMGNPNFRFVKDSITNQETVYKCDDFYHPNDEGGVVWNDPTIGVVWPGVMGEYKGTASAEGYSVDGVALNLSDKDQKWVSIKDTFKF